MENNEEILTKLVVNCETGEETLMQLTSEEIEQLRQYRENFEEQEAIRLAEEQAKTEAKAAALAKLTALGLTEEEVNALTK